MKTKILYDAEPITQILRELKNELQNRYGTQLKGVILFGSYARGKQKSGSDIDIAIILEDFSHACTEIEHTGDIVSSLSLKFDTLISLVPIKEKDWLKRKTSLISNIRRDGVVV
ncbi:MAG: nucleotidyltransferase domain-containing protein [Candidatus Methanomarinus sp.]|uniref:Nucleotidyltransferase domain-containing protein n=1 Tax=Candidatus Methanomarinus sp. TaxID=3386244 RepID=A0AC61S9H4_9EURY|nr:MAG: Nucleotidyltransferase domain protein [ANME-2 cluster archaeon HR1]TKY91101.1 MAG: nucleotidyltransferase domain-containing protein [ANME-2 cluster archaeon]